MICRPFRTPKLMLPDRGLKPPAITQFPFREPEFVPCLLMGYHDRTIVPVWQYIKMEAFQGRD